MKKILVTGANGQLGQTLREKSNEKFAFIFCDKTQLDIADKSVVASFFDKNEIDICINCAAFTNVKLAEKKTKKAEEVNVKGVRNLIDNCLKFNIKLINISTDYVFDGKKSEPYNEEDEVNPLNEYGRSKQKGEELIQQSDLEYYIVRTSWLYSKKYGKNFYRTILEKAKVEERISVVDNQIGTPTETDSLADFLLNLVLSNASKGIYHFSDEKIKSWYEFAKEIVAENNLNCHITPHQITSQNSVLPLYSALTTIKKV